MPQKSRPLVIGTRGSKLALAQSEQVAAALRKAHPDLDLRLEIIQTRGDEDQSTALGRNAEVGFFTRELEMALLQEKIDLAVHSLKDLPIEQPDGLTVGLSVPQREDVRDVLVTTLHCGFYDLAPGSRIGTGSLRRQSQLAHLRSDILFEPIRGNVDTRLRKVQQGQFDGTVLALAGLRRSGLFEKWMEVVSLQRVLPAPAQGALGLELRSDDERMARIIAAIDHPASRQAVMAERSLLKRIGGGCHAPVAAYGQLDPLSQALMLEGLIASADGRQAVRRSIEGRSDAAAELGIELAERILADGGQRILDDLTAEGTL